MAVTLVEAAKRNSGDVVLSAVIELYARSSEILRVLPFNDIEGNAYRYNREGALPGIGFRGVNESYTESTGVLNPVTEGLTIAGGDLDVDKFIVRTQGQDQRAAQEAMKIKSLAHSWTKSFIKGDSETDPREFDGLQKRLVGNQLVSAGATSGGDPLSLFKLDEAIDECENANALVMNKTMRRRLTQAARNTSVGGFIQYTQDEFGRQVALYNGLPILDSGKDNEYSEILAFNEAAAGGGSTATSIYVVSFADQYVQGLQNGGIEATDLGELQEKPVFRTRVEWYSTIAVMHPKAAVRLYGVSNAAVVV